MIFYYTRQKEFEQGQKDTKIAPGYAVPGGGMNAKALNFTKSVNGKIIGDLKVGSGIVLVDPLAITQTHAEEGDDRFYEYMTSPMTKILWLEEQEVFRWSFSKRKMLVAYAQGVLCCNEYMQNLLAQFDIKAQVLYTPIDDNLYKPAKQKKPQLVALGQVSHAKRTDTMLRMFERLPKDIEPIYIGSAALWGLPSRKADTELEKLVSQYCTHIPSASHEEVARILGESWAMASMTIYDVGSLAFIEAGLSGCNVYAHIYHRMFDEYDNVERTSDNPEYMADEITAQFTKFDGKPNLKLRKELIKKHSYGAFQKQLKIRISDVIVSEPQDEEGEGYGVVEADGK